MRKHIPTLWDFLIHLNSRCQLSAAPGLGPVAAEKRIRKNSGIKIEIVILPSKTIRSRQKVKEEKVAWDKRKLQAI